MATRVFSDEELEGLRSFPAIGKAELVPYFTLTRGPGSSAGRGGQRWADTRLSGSSAHSRRARGSGTTTPERLASCSRRAAFSARRVAMTVAAASTCR